MSLAAGRLDKRVTLQRPVLTKNAVGEEEVTWQDVATVWAAVERLSGRELWRARQMTADATHRLTLRVRAALGLAADWRLLLGERAFHLLEPPRNRVTRGELWEFLCREEQSAGITPPEADIQLDFSEAGNSGYLGAV